ncbi:unnamed protein product [Effrenium voratum]|nr:unnamed protein product [Effrenium voratum]
MSLPPNWQRYTTDEGKEYFHNAVTNKTQWERPSEEVGSNAMDTADVFTYKPSAADLEDQLPRASSRAQDLDDIFASGSNDLVSLTDAPSGNMSASSSSTASRSTGPPQQAPGAGASAAGGFGGFAAGFAAGAAAAAAGRGEAVPQGPVVGEAERRVLLGSVTKASVVREGKEKLVRREVALAQTQRMKELFDQFDADKDGCLSQLEVIEYSQGEFDFTPPESCMERLWRNLVPAGKAGISFDCFLQMKLTIGTARVVEKERQTTQGSA